MKTSPIIDDITLVLLCFSFIIINVVQSQEEIEQKYVYNKRYNTDSTHEILYPIEHPNEVEEHDHSNEIPLEVFESLQNLTPEEFAKKYVNESLIEESDELSHDFEGVNVARGAIIKPKQAICKPMEVSVPVTPNTTCNDTSISNFMYNPSCIFVKRCGACCASPALECQPTEITVLNIPTTKLSIFQNGVFQHTEHFLVPIEQHERCTCQCKTKREHCNKYQQYDAKNCKCNCINFDYKSKCDNDPNKIWLSQNCTCSCRSFEQCTTGLYFNLNECRCMKKIGTTQLTPIVSDIVNRRQFIIKPIIIDPDNNTSYDTQGQ